jgi:hypothetical protein
MDPGRRTYNWIGLQSSEARLQDTRRKAHSVRRSFSGGGRKVQGSRDKEGSEGSGNEGISLGSMIHFFLPTNRITEPFPL